MGGPGLLCRARCSEGQSASLPVYVPMCVLVSVGPVRAFVSLSPVCSQPNSDDRTGRELSDIMYREVESEWFCGSAAPSRTGHPQCKITGWSQTSTALPCITVSYTTPVLGLLLFSVRRMSPEAP